MLGDLLPLMPARHSKKRGSDAVFTYDERKKQVGEVTNRLGADSQLPFGHCNLTLTAISEGAESVVSPSGRIYGKEAILEYLLSKTRDLKLLQVLYEEQCMRKLQEEEEAKESAERMAAAQFAATQDGVQGIVVGGGKDERSLYINSSARKKLIDDRSIAVRIEELKAISPWLAQFTPSAKAKDLKAPPKRPPSPCSGQPLRAKDLYPIVLSRDADDDQAVVCSVSGKRITSQPVVYLKPSHVYMLEECYKHLALPTMTCPLTSKPFLASDVVELHQAGSSFAGGGVPVEATKWRPTKL